MEVTDRRPHLLHMAVMVEEVGGIKIPTIGAEGVELGEEVDEPVVMEAGEVVVATEVDEVEVVVEEVVGVVEAVLEAEEGAGEGVEEIFQVKEGGLCRGVEVWELAQQLV